MRPAPISDLAPDRVLLLGDAHGNTPFVEYALSQAVRNHCPVVVQLGDFGFWEHTAAGQRFLDDVARASTQTETTVLFLDGNHENHDLLDAYVEERRVGDDGVVWVRPRVGWLTRGTRWVWHDQRFAALGGAASVDRERRRTGWSWWPQEVLSETDLHTLGNDPVDVLFAHDAPSAARMVGTATVGAFDLDRCTASRAILDRAIARTRPHLVVHGHWHRRHHTEIDGVDGYVIEGFGCDSDTFTDAVGVLDVARGAVLPLELDQTILLWG